MYCTRCGKPLARVSLRCPECRRVTPAFWLNFSAVAFLVIAVVVNYLYFRILLPVVASYFAGMGVVLPLPARLHKNAADLVVEFLPFIVLILIVVWLLARYKKIRVPGIFVSGTLLTALVWGALAFTFVGWIGAFVEVVIQLPNPLFERRILSRLNAVQSLMLIHEAQAKYRQAYPQAGFTCSLDDLKSPGSGQAADAHQAGLLNESIIRGHFLDYSFQARECAGTPVARYVAMATPMESALGAQRLYCMNESGAIRFSDDGKEETCLQKLIVPK